MKHLLAWLSERVNLTALWVLGFAIASISCAIPFAHAANVTVSLTVTPTSASGPTPVTLNWTSSGAGSCTASDGWSGGKSAQGTETVPSITKTTKFSLTCISPTGPATLSWTPPTLFSDGSAIQTITGYQVMIGPDANTLSRGPLLPATPTTNVVIQAPPGKQFFTLRTESTFNGVPVESPDSVATSKTVVADQATGAVTVSIAVVPNPPTNVTVQ